MMAFAGNMPRVSWLRDAGPGIVVARYEATGKMA